MALTAAAYVVADGTVLPGVDMRPDLVVKKSGTPVAVADVKYKRTDDIGEFKNPDLYQLFAYCSALGLPRGLLIYADAQPHTTQRVQLPGFGDHVDLDAIGIDLSKPWREVLQQAQSTADALQAVARLSDEGENSARVSAGP